MRYLLFLLIVIYSCKNNQAEIESTQSEVNRTIENIIADKRMLDNANVWNDSTLEKTAKRNISYFTHRLDSLKKRITELGGTVSIPDTSMEEFNRDMRKDSMELVQKFDFIDWETKMIIEKMKQGMREAEAKRYTDSIAVHELFNERLPEWYVEMKKHEADKE